MDFEKFREFTPTTNTYKPEENKMCLELGYIEEVGDFSGKLKKMYRDNDDKMDVDWTAGIILELGDICWYTSELLNAYKVDTENVKNKNILSLSLNFDEPKIIEDLPKLLNSILINRSGWVSFYRNFYYCIHTAADFLQVPVGFILDQNQAKLLRRKQEGKIGGNGDYR